MGQEIKLLDIAALSGAVTQGQACTHPERVLGDEKLTLAVGMFWAASSSRDPRVRFVLLVTVLEILTPGSKRPKLSQDVLVELLDYLEKHPDKSNDELTKLRSCIGNLKNSSITDNICELAFHCRPADSKQPAGRKESDRNIRELYGIRSDLVHNGKVAKKGGNTPKERLAANYERLRMVVSELLRFQMEHPV